MSEYREILTRTEKAVRSESTRTLHDQMLLVQEKEVAALESELADWGTPEGKRARLAGTMMTMMWSSYSNRTTMS